MRPVETADDHLRMAEAEPVGDVLADRRRRGGGQRDDRRSSDLADDVTERKIVRPKVVTPGGQAMRLVDRDQRRAKRLHLGDPLRRRELLGRDEQESGGAVAYLGQR